MAKKKTLSDKEIIFIEHYIRCWKGAPSARAAGISEKNAANWASLTLMKPYIQEAIEERLKDIRMKTGEIYARLSEQARADLSEFVEFYDAPVLDKTGTHVGFKQAIKIKPDTFEKHGHLIKSIAPASNGDFRIELHNSQAALELMGKSYSLFTEKDDDGNPLTDEQRIARVVAILDAARARRTG